MILHYVECADGTRHVHKPDCEGLKTQSDAGEVWEIEVDEIDEDEILLAIWDDFEPTTDELDGYAEMTVYRDCASLFTDSESSGNPKADAFMDEAEQAGWEVVFTEDEGLIKVNAQREYIGEALRTHEVLDLSWSPTRLIEAHYLSGLPGDVAKKLSSVAGAITRLNSPQPTARKTSNTVKRDEPVKRIPKEKLPFDIEEAYDDEIFDAVRGRKLVWLNTTSENYEEARVGMRYLRIETGTAGRAILTFCSPEGFRSVALENLVQVK
jgi:hypothetical protein